jgi:IS30 family transposase
MKGLRQERKMRQPRIYAHYRRQRIQDIISISERPKEAEGRIVPGYWEGDFIIGKKQGKRRWFACGTNYKTHASCSLKAKDAFTVRNSFSRAFKHIPDNFKSSLTYDRGMEMSQHKLFTKETNIQVYFADPYSPWQRGANENTNGLIRQYFPKGTDFHSVSTDTLKEAEYRLNSRPRKVLGYYTPLEKFYQLVTGRKIALAT